MRSRVVAVAVGLMAALVLSGCDGAPAGEGLVGRVVAIDDTGLGDSATGGGWLVAVPASRAPDLWATTDEGERPADLAHAGVELDQTGVEALDGVVAEVTDKGWFRLDAPAGPAVVCWIVPAEGGPTVSRGCSEIDLPEDGRLTAKWGEGGFSLRVE